MAVGATAAADITTPGPPAVPARREPAERCGGLFSSARADGKMPRRSGDPQGERQ
jgi:hypothetical protein